MKKNNGGRYIFLSCLIFILIIILFTLFKLVAFEGFNPSDDGVIAAQSYRLLHGEIPHKDFIAIRPAGSGYFHMLDYILPLPMMEAGRWLTIFEYFIYAACWLFLALLAVQKVNFIREKPLIISCLLVIAFCLTIQIRHLFPWTTVDAIFFDSLGILFLTSGFAFNSFTIKNYFSVIIAFIFLSIAALCRQTFVLPLGFAGLAVLIAGYRSGKLTRAILTGLTGILPILIYFSYLFNQGALPDFKNQMTGRTELFHTGIFEYGVHLFYTPWVLLYFFYFVLLFAPLFKKFIPVKYMNLFDLVTACIIVVTSIAMFFPNYQKTIPFVFFWTCMYLTGRLWLAKKKGIPLFLSIAVLVVSWTASISLGDNSPLFCSGILISVVFMQLFVLHEESLHAFFSQNKKRLTAFPVSAAFALAFTIYSQGRNNYRDLSRTYLTEKLDDYFPAMGNIHTCANTRLYFDELMRIKNELQIPSGHLVVLPNNAAIYPLLESPNPFPIDWAQANEYIGAEDKMLTDIKSALTSQKLFILVDKMDSKYMFDGYEPFKPDYDFNHAYLPLITNAGLCTKVHLNNPFFDVYISNSFLQ